MVGAVPALSFANVAASIAVLLSAAALAVALLSGGDGAPPADEPAVVERARQADRAERAETAESAERSRTARTAARASEADSADRLRGREGRRLDDASRRAGGVRRPEMLTLSPGESETVLRSGPFRVRVACEEGPRVRVGFSSTHEGSLVSVEGTPGVAIDGDGRMLLELKGERAIWNGGRSFSLSSPEGPVLEGVLSFGVNQLGADCVASAAGLT